MPVVSEGRVTDWDPLEVSAVRIGRFVWVEERLFEIIGHWVQSTADDEIAALFAVQSRHRSWYAELLGELVFGFGDRTRESLVASPGPGVGAVLAQLANIAGADASIARLTALHRVVVPHAVSAHRAQLLRSSVVADGPAIRRLGRVIADELLDWQEGEALLQARVRGDAELDAALDAQRSLQQLLVTSEGISGDAALLRS